MKRKLRMALRAQPFGMCFVLGLMLLHSTVSGQQVNSPPSFSASSRRADVEKVVHRKNNLANLEITVSGKIIDETQQPVPGVNILLKGTTTGTTSDGDGAYKLTVPDENGNPGIFFYWICNTGS